MGGRAGGWTPRPTGLRRRRRLERDATRAASAAIGQVAGWDFAFNPATLVVAVVFSLAVGVLFGVWPARQAAHLDPISALRYE